jgi:Spy/CpxP family protein refolding chaperone
MRGHLAAAVGVVSAALLVGAPGALAQPLGPGDEGPGPGGFRGPGRLLELSQEQREAARRIFEQQRPEMEALQERMRENREHLREALESGSPDPMSVGELVIEGHALKEKDRALHEQSKEAFEALLTPEQKRKLEMLEAARAIGGPPRGPRGMMGPGGDVGFPELRPRGVE